MAASAQVRSSRELRPRQDLCSFSWGTELSGAELSKVGIGRIASPELEVNSGIGEISSPEFGLFNSVGKLECSVSETWWLKVLRGRASNSHSGWGGGLYLQ